MTIDQAAQEQDSRTLSSNISRAGHQAKAGEERDRKLPAVMLVEVKLGKQVTERDAEKRTGREGQSRAGEPGSRIAANQGSADKEADNTQW